MYGPHRQFVGRWLAVLWLACDTPFQLSYQRRVRRPCLPLSGLESSWWLVRRSLSSRVEPALSIRAELQRYKQQRVGCLTLSPYQLEYCLANKTKPELGRWCRSRLCSWP